MKRRASNQSVSLDTKFYALSDATRRMLIERLSQGPASMKQLADPLPASLPTILKHLAILESGGIVRSEKSGRVRTFRIEHDAFADLESWVAERKRGWTRRLDQLEQFLAEQALGSDRKETR